ncbi:MAG: helix-turn-helix transcriptional regulator [Rhodospirillales bacterium]|nr:helix-turn-helix transcriptional regulator [Alphaproteobacteria bacterium]MBL6947138.1 helix-turn-helix transcriptional regulator [Rhodospirillales bacterium]
MDKSEKKQFVEKINRLLGRRLALRREEIGRTAAEMDRALSLSPGSVAAMEKGRRGMDVGLLVSLSHAFGVPVSYFFQDARALSGAPMKGLPSPERVAGAERFVAVYSRIEDQNIRRDILGLMKAAGDCL